MTTPDQPAEVIDIAERPPTTTAAKKSADSTARAAPRRLRLAVGGAVLLDPHVDPLPPAEQPVDPLVAVLGDLGAGDLPPAHDDALVHRQLAPDVADGQHVVEAGVRHQDDVGVGGGVQRGEEAARPGGEHVGHRLGALRHPLEAQLAQPLDAAGPPALGEVAALGEDHERVVLVEAGGQLGDLLLEPDPAAA